MTPTTSKTTAALAIACLLLLASPAHAQPATTEDAASIIQRIQAQIPTALCGESFYRRCFEASVQQCQTDMAAVRLPCDASVSPPLAPLAQALEADNPEPYVQFGRSYSTCLVRAHATLPKFNQAAVNACLAQPPFRVEILIPLIRGILED